MINTKFDSFFIYAYNSATTLEEQEEKVLAWKNKFEKKNKTIVIINKLQIRE